MIAAESLFVNNSFECKNMVLEIIIYILFVSIHEIVQKDLLEHILTDYLHLFFVIYHFTFTERAFLHLLKGLQSIALEMLAVKIVIDLTLKLIASSSVNHRNRLDLCAIQ